MSDETITTIEITLARMITGDGKMAFRLTTPSSYNSVELLGLLEAAKLHIFNEINRNKGEL